MQFGQDKLFSGQDDPVSAFETNYGSAVFNRFHSILHLENPAIGGELRGRKIVLQAHTL